MGSKNSRITPSQYKKILEKNNGRQEKMRKQRKWIEYHLSRGNESFNSEPIYPEILEEYKSKGFTLVPDTTLDKYGPSSSYNYKVITND